MEEDQETKKEFREETKENESLNRYIKEFRKDVELNIHNLREKSLMISSIRSKWLNYYFVEKENLERIRKAKQKILTNHASKSGFQDSVIKLKTEDSLAKNDKNLIRLNALLETTKSIIEYIEMGLNILNDFGFSIKNSIEVLKLEKM